MTRRQAARWIEAYLAAREEAGEGAINPVYALDAAAFSDVFLALGLAPAVALIAAFGLRGRGDKRGGGRSGKA